MLSGHFTGFDTINMICDVIYSDQERTSTTFCIVANALYIESATSREVFIIFIFPRYVIDLIMHIWFFNALKTWIILEGKLLIR